MSEAYKYLDKELSKVYGTDEDITLAKSILVMFLEDYHKQQLKKDMPSDEEKREAYRSYQLGEVGNEIYEEGAFISGMEYLKNHLLKTENQ